MTHYTYLNVNCILAIRRLRLLPPLATLAQPPNALMLASIPPIARPRGINRVGSEVFNRCHNIFPDPCAKVPVFRKAASNDLEGSVFDNGILSRLDLTELVTLNSLFSNGLMNESTYCVKTC